MELHAIETGRFRLDGGAMFGVVPKPLWSRTNPADDRNRIDLAMRALLIRDGNRAILVDNGLGHKYDTKFADLYALDQTHTLQSSLAAIGMGLSDITDLVLTHLHFDHAGGTTGIDPASGQPRVIFPHARIWLQRNHLQWAQQPNARETASFFRENVQPIAEWDNLHLLDGPAEIAPGITLKLVHGHTESQQLPLIEYKGHRILYSADLFATHGHIPLPYVMGYDTRPLLSLQERADLLPWLAQERIVLFYEHDPVHECGLVEQVGDGKFKSGEVFPLSNLG